MDQKIFIYAKTRTKEYLNGKKFIPIAVTLFLISSVFLFTYKPISNFWANLYNSMGNGIINTMFFSLIIINTLFFVRDNKLDYFYFNRIGSFKQKIKYNILSAININSIIFFAFIIFNVSFSILASSNNYSVISVNYEIELPIQIVYEIIKYYFYVILVSSCICILTNFRNKKVACFSILFLIILTIIPPSQNHIIESIFDTSLQYTFFLNHMLFSSIKVEILSTLINISVLLIINILLFNYISKRKVDFE